MNNPTDEELDALVVWLEELPCCHDGPHETSARCKSCEKTVADAITTLRTQLAEAKADKEKLGRELNLARYGQPDFSWQVHKEALAEANARADRAEAALAAQIEVDAMLAEKRYDRCERDNVGPCYLRKCAIGAVIRYQPHDRTALDRMLAEAREQALRDAADEMEDERAKQAILALIEKP